MTDLRNLLAPFYGYMEAQGRQSRAMKHQQTDTMDEPATQLLEERSVTYPERMNVMIEAGSFDACQAMIFTIMDDESNVTFTLPVRAANGSFVAIGHYQINPEPPLPEL